MIQTTLSFVSEANGIADMPQRQQKTMLQKIKPPPVTKKPAVSSQQPVHKKSAVAQTKKTMPQVKQATPTLHHQSGGVSSPRKKKNSGTEETCMRWIILCFTLILFPTLILSGIVTLVVTKNLEVAVLLILIAFVLLYHIVCHHYPTNSSLGAFTALLQVILTFLKKH